MAVTIWWDLCYDAIVNIIQRLVYQKLCPPPSTLPLKEKSSTNNKSNRADNDNDNDTELGNFDSDLQFCNVMWKNGCIMKDSPNNLPFPQYNNRKTSSNDDDVTTGEATSIQELLQRLQEENFDLQATIATLHAERSWEVSTLRQEAAVTESKLRAEC
jgi:hypothetical protein